jgi:biotin carboxylase
VKTFLFIEARSTECSGIGYIRELGYSPVLLCSKLVAETVSDGVDLAAFDEVHDVDTRNASAVLHLIQTQAWHVGAVLGCYDFVMICASEVAQRLCLPHPSLEGLRNAYSKEKVRDLLAAHGHPQPAYELVSAGRFPTFSRVRFPLVVKPLTDAGEYGVSLCRNLGEYRRTVQNIARGVSESLHGGAHTEFIIEEFIDGVFYGAEMIYFSGEWHIVGFNRIFLSSRDSLCMTGISHPSDLSAENLDALGRTIKEWVRVLGLRGGALNVEFILTAAGPRLVEINLRIAGARVAQQVRLTTGIDLIALLVDFACGQQRTPLRHQKTGHQFVADSFVLLAGGDRVKNLTVPETGQTYISSEFRRIPFIAATAADNFGSIIGHVMAHGGTCEEAMQNATRLARGIKVQPNASNDSVSESVEFARVGAERH